MKHAMDLRQPRPHRQPAAAFDCALVMLDDAGRPHLVLGAPPPAAADNPLPGSAPAPGTR
jgi:hypothetical protein